MRADPIYIYCIWPTPKPDQISRIWQGCPTTNRGGGGGGNRKIIRKRRLIINSVFLPKKDLRSPMLLFLSEFNTDPNQLQERNMKRGKEELNQSDLDKAALLGAVQLPES